MKADKKISKVRRVNWVWEMDEREIVLTKQQ